MRLLHLPVRSGEDVFALRQQGRHVARAAGFDDPDQVRLATALSELGRDVHGLSRAGGSVSFDIDRATDTLTISVTGLDERDIDRAPGILAARRLMPSVEVVPASGTERTVILSKPLPQPLTGSDVERVQQRIAAHTVASPLDELREQNRELLVALEQITARQHDLEALNHELEDTNRGVMAMYAQLSDELETTNRGVLALYAELDDTSRRLREASEAKSRFLSSVSHELRSPLSSVLGLTRLLLDPLGQPLHAEQRHQVDLINATASELLELVSQLLDLARAESGKLQPVMAPVDVAALIDGLINAMSPLAPSGVTLGAHLPRTPLLVGSDEALLRAVLRNLVANALSFTEAGSVDIVVTEERRDARLLIEVRDTGIGVPPADLERIFEEFFQVRNHLQTRRRGTGLGLAHARRVAEVLGGSLHATSVLGQGSTFTLSLPASRPEWATPRPPVAPLRPSAAAPASTPLPVALRRAIVADDDAAFRAVLVGMLAGMVEDIVETDDGSTVCDLIRLAPTDLVLLDLIMPGQGGAEVLAAVRADAALDTAVVVVTSTDLHQAIGAGLPAEITVVAKQTLSVEALRAAIVRATARGQGG